MTSNIHENGPSGSLKPTIGGPHDVFVKITGDTAIPLPMIERAEGIYFWDEDGNRYIDMSSGPIVSNIGHAVPAVAEAMAKQATTMDFAYYSMARHRPNMQLAEQISRLAGPGYERVCFGSGGSEGNEVAVKFLRQYALAHGQPNKRHVITCMPSYHGGSLATLSWSGDVDLGDFLDGMVAPSPKVPAPFSYRIPPNHTVESYALHCADQLRQKIRELGAENVLAFMIEPVGGVATGCLVPHDSYFREVRKICDDAGIHLIFDEVMSGSGRAGKFLTAHYLPDAMPDIVVLAKGLGAGYVPLAAVLVPAAMADPLAEKLGFSFFHTYTANPVACAAGIAVLDHLEKNDLMSNAAKMGDYLRGKLEALKDKISIVGDVRGRGLLMSVELVADQETKALLSDQALASNRVRIHGLKNGLIIYTRRTSGGNNGDWFIVAPPLCVTQPECDDILERLEKTLRAVQEEFTSLGII